MSMSLHTEPPQAGGTYLLTEDLAEKIELLSVRTPGFHDSFYQGIQDQLADAVQKAVGEDNEVLRVPMYKLASQANAYIDKTWDEPVLVVSTCPELAYPARGVSIEVNRLVDLQGMAIGVGPRPGHPPLAQQVMAIARQAGTRPVVIAEDGIFSGTTLKSIVGALQTAGINIAGIVAGFRFKLEENKVLEEMGIPISVIHPEIDNLIDWVPDHDFLPFTPGCGKVLGSMVGNDAYPFYDHDQATFCVPYVAPFGPVTRWASLPEERVEAFSRECLDIARRIYESLEELNGPLLITDVMSSRQRVGVPIVAGDAHQGLPSSRQRVVDFLEEWLS